MTASAPAMNERIGLVDTVDHLLNRGAVLTGEATISIAGVDLIYLGLKVLLTSVENFAGPRAPAPGARSLAPAGPGQVRGPAAPAHGQWLRPGRGYVTEEGQLAVEGGAGGSGGGFAAERPDGAAGLAQLVLTLVELLRQVVERQALRRMEGGALDDEEVERMGQALMELEQKMAELKAAFKLSDEDLDIDLGPLGRLL